MVGRRHRASDEATLDVILKQFENPDEVVHFEQGKFETVTLGAGKYAK